MSPNNTKHDFSGKVALVTGSSSGIGTAIATQFAQYGARVVITGRNEANLQKIADQIAQVSGGMSAHQVIGDLLYDSFPKCLIDETIGKFGQLDILVNNAGAGTPDGSLSSANLLQEFDNMFRLKVRAVVELTQRALPHLELTKGNIINISSVGSLSPFAVVYSASDAALDMMTKTSALELGSKGIRVNSINPGFVATSYGRSMGLSDPNSLQNMFDAMLPDLLLKRYGQPEDIANLASFLASDEAGNITGSICVSDSGVLLKPVPINSDALAAH